MVKATIRVAAQDVLYFATASLGLFNNTGPQWTNYTPPPSTTDPDCPDLR